MNRTRGFHGLARMYERQRDGACANRIWSLTDSDSRLNFDAIQRTLAGELEPTASIFVGIDQARCAFNKKSLDCARRVGCNFQVPAEARSELQGRGRSSDQPSRDERSLSVFAVDPGFRARDERRKQPESGRPSIGQVICERGSVVELSTLLVETVRSIAAAAKSPALALGGGLDSAVVLAAWRATGLPLPALYTLVTGIDGYDEVKEAEELAAAFGVKVESIWAPPELMRDLASRAAIAAEVPFRNLHPVSRLALSSAVFARGHCTLITGDGADALFRGVPDWDYVPLMAALTQEGGLVLASPFLEDDVTWAILIRGQDSEKRALRAVAEELGVPEWLVSKSKRARTVPSEVMGSSELLDEMLAALLSRARQGAA